MLVRDLIDFLKIQDPDLEVQITLVGTDPDDENTLDVSTFPVAQVIYLPEDEEEDEPGVVWLVGGEDEDVEDFLDTISGDDLDDLDD